MNIKFKLFLFSILCPAVFFSQQSKQKKDSLNHHLYNIKIFDEKNNITASGLLFHVSDSSLTVIPDIDYFVFTMNRPFEKIMVPFYKIEKIKIWRQNKFWRSAGIGVACGAGLGALLGFGSGDDTGNNGFVVFTAGQKAVMVGILGSLGGLVIGSIIGCTRRIIFIHRNLVAFSKNKQELKKKSIEL